MIKIKLPLEFGIGVFLTVFFSYMLCKSSYLIGDILSSILVLISIFLIIISIDFKGDKEK